VSMISGLHSSIVLSTDSHSWCISNVLNLHQGPSRVKRFSESL
jgi:hypothetical protein